MEKITSKIINKDFVGAKRSIESSLFSKLASRFQEKKISLAKTIKGK